MEHPERIIPDETSAGILALHLKRYAFALPYVDGAEVLDAACGVGYGAAHLAQRASRVIGVDVAPGTIDYARDRYSASNVEFRLMDVTNLEFGDGSFDVVVSFETIEHVPDAQAAVSEAARVLRDGGLYIVSTPRVEETSMTPENPFHSTEYSPADFTTLLETSFAHVELYGQRRIETRRHQLLRRLDIFGFRRRVRLPQAATFTGSRATPDLTLDDISIAVGDLDQATEIVAVCRLDR